MIKVFLLQLSNFSSGVSNAIVTISIPWLILEKSDSPSFAGLVVALSAIPALIISPISGWFVDHLGRKTVSISADVLSAISVIAFPIVTWQFELTNSLILILALIGAVFDPAGYTARKTLLIDTAQQSGMNQEKLNGIHEGVFGVGWVFGPAIGAWLIATFGVINSFTFASLLFIVAAISILFLKIDNKKVHINQEKVKNNNLSQGFKVLWKDKLLRTITISVLILAAIYLPTESIILPTYFENLGKPAQLGVVISALAAGSTFGSFGYGFISARISKKSLVRITFIGSSLSMVPMALLPPTWIMVIAGFFLGLFWGPFNPLMTSLIQNRVTESEHGRVFGLQLSAFYAAPPIGMVLTGVSVEQIGLQSTYLGLAFVLGLTSIFVLLTKALRANF